MFKGQFHETATLVHDQRYLVVVAVKSLLSSADHDGSHAAFRSFQDVFDAGLRRCNQSGREGDFPETREPKDKVEAHQASLDSRKKPVPTSSIGAETEKSCQAKDIVRMAAQDVILVRIQLRCLDQPDRKVLSRPVPNVPTSSAPKKSNYDSKIRLTFLIFELKLTAIFDRPCVEFSNRK